MSPVSSHVACLLMACAAITASPSNETSPLGINLHGVIDWATEIPFNNYAKRARPWISQCNGCGWNQGGELDLDEHGWVRSLAPGHTAVMILASGPKFVPGDYYVFFEGEGRMRGTVRTTGTVTSSGDMITMAPTDGGYQALEIVETNPDNHIRDIAVIHVDNHERYQLGEIFDSTFLANWAPYRTLRFMDWGHTNGSHMSQWNDRPLPQHYTYGGSGGVPYEIMIRLANTLNTYAWFCIPHMADDDYVRRFAELVRDNLHPHLRIYVEHSNEVWNGNFQEQFSYCNAKGAELGLRMGDSEFHGHTRYHALRTAQIMEIWNEVIGSRERLTGVLAVGGPREFMIRTGMDYLRSIGKGDLIDVAGVAPYVGSGESYSNIDQAIKVLNDGLDEYAQRLQSLKSTATDYGLRLVAYEGGQHLWKFGDDFSAIGEAAQADPRMYDWVMRYLRIWKEKGGDEFMVFASGGGFWGQIPWGMNAMDAPKYKARYDFIMQNPLWWDEPFVSISQPAQPVMPGAAHAAATCTFDLLGRTLPRVGRAATIPSVLVNAGNSPALLVPVQPKLR